MHENVWPGFLAISKVVVKKWFKSKLTKWVEVLVGVTQLSFICPLFCLIYVNCIFNGILFKKQQQHIVVNLVLLFSVPLA